MPEQPKPLTTSVTELRAIANALLDHLAERGDVIELSHDFYWFLQKDDRRVVGREPSDITIGQLAENLDFLRSMITSQDVIAYGLVWIAEILRTIGEDNIA